MEDPKIVLSNLTLHSVISQHVLGTTLITRLTFHLYATVHKAFFVLLDCCLKINT